MRRLALLIAVLLVVAVSAAACGSDLGDDARRLVLPDHPCDARLVLIDPTESRWALLGEVDELHRACAEAEPR